MERIDEQELERLKKLLSQTSEFIAYFELADCKMLQWRQDVELQASIQLKLLRQMNQHQQELAQLTQQTLSKMEEQKGDENPAKFSYLDTEPLKEQRSCWITYTNQEVHDVLKTGFEKSESGN